MARIGAPAGWRTKVMAAAARASRPLVRRFAGLDTAEPMTPLVLASHAPAIAQVHGLFELALFRSKATDFRLRELVRMRVGTLHGCPW